MGVTLTVPAQFVSYLRRGLFDEWGCAAEDVSDLALEFGGDASENAYDEPLQRFDTIRALLDEIGRKETSPPGDAAIDFDLGDSFIIKALRSEYLALVEQFEQLPKKTRQEMRDEAIAKVEALGGFIKLVNAHAGRLSDSPPESSASTHLTRAPLRRRPSRDRRRQH